MRYTLKFVALALASIGGALLGLALLPAGANAALVWPPSAIGIAALFLYGYDLWPAILLSITGVLFIRGGNLPLDVAIGIGNTLEVLLGAYILKRYINLNPLLNTLGNAIGIITASIAPSLVYAGVATLSSYYLGGVSAGGIETMWVDLWIGHAVTCLSFTPFLVRWIIRPFFTKTKKEIFEGIFVFSSIAALSYFLFWTPYGTIGSVSLVYVLILPLLWAAIRTGPRGTTLSLVLLSLIATSGVVYGQSTLSMSHDPQTIFLLQVLLGVLDIIFILIAAIIEERTDITNSLASSIAELSLAVEKISREDQAKANFLAILAHELRNPLAPIVSSVELLKMKKNTEEEVALIDTIESHMSTISILLDDLLDITRITHNKFELRREPVVLQSVIKRSIETVNTLITSRKHELRIEVPEKELELEADPVRLEQVFVNLLSNAAKYTDVGGTITLAAAQQGNTAVITVSDNGIGMAEDKIAGIFELFGQIRDMGRGSGGLGVGLALTKRLVDEHRGTIEAHSLGLGAGSAFTVRLPLMQTSSTVKKSKLADALRLVQEPQQAKKGLRILVVDDNKPAAQALSKLLEHAGHEVAIAYDGGSAVIAAQDFIPTVVILDIGLPDMTGYEAGKKIREALSTPLRLIALTGYGQENDRVKTREACFDAHLVKPVGIKDVEKVLR